MIWKLLKQLFFVFNLSFFFFRNSELKNELKPSRAELPSSPSKLSISSSQLDTLTTCLCEIIGEKEIGKQEFIDL